MSNDLIIALVISVIGFLTAVSVPTIAQVFMWRTMQQQREWDIDDRKRLEKIANETHKVVLEVSKKTDNVGQKADAAYMEANNANIKIQAVFDTINEGKNKPIRKITNTDTGENS